MNPTPAPTHPFSTQYRLFAPGDLLIYYNWLGYQKPIDQKWFNPLTMSQLQDLHPGDHIWIEGELSPNGNVYGYRLVAIVSTMTTTHGLLISWRGGEAYGSFTIGPKTHFPTIAELTNENAVYVWTLNHRYARRIC